MKTRGKGKTDIGLTDLNDPRDFLEEGENTNGFNDERADDGAPGRTDGRGKVNAANRRQARVPRAGPTKSRTDKSIMESEEFRDVVAGFVAFIEEINKKKKKPARTEPKPYNRATDEKLGIPEKRIKTNTAPSHAQSAEEMKSDAMNAEQSKQLYNDYKEGLPPGREPVKEQPTPKPSGNFPSAPETKPAFTDKPFSSHITDALLEQTKLLQVAQSLQGRNPANFNQNHLFKELMGLGFNGDRNPVGNYFMPSYDQFNVKASPNELLNLQMIDALLQKNPANLLGLLSNAGAPNANHLFGDMTYNLLQNMNPHSISQRAGNQPLGMELLQSDNDVVINPKTFEGKLGRASTHVAIAYFIYFKSLDPGTMAGTDKNKMDPTYNARMLKEKKFEAYPPEASMINKLLPQGFDQRLGNMGLGGQMPMDFMNSADLQRLLAHQGVDPMRELQAYRESLMRGNNHDELLQRAAGYQGGKNDMKLEESVESQRRRANEARAPQRGTQSKEEIIEIKENSEGEPDEKIEDASKIEAKDEVKSEAKEQRPSLVDQTGESLKTKERLDENVSAEDIVEEITELTNPGLFDQNKNKRAKPSGKKPVKKPSEEPGKPGTQGKAYAVEEEGEAQSHTGNKNAEGEAGGVQVILSSDEEGKAGEEKK